MSYWEKNLEILRRLSPETARLLARTPVPATCRVLPSRAGPPVLQVDGVSLHSAYDPVQEGLTWVQTQDLKGDEPLVVFGLGLGYHILPLLEPPRPLFVVEPSLAVARLALEHQDLTPLLARNALRLGRDFTGLPRPARLVAYSPSQRLAPGLYQRLARFLAGRPLDLGPWKILVISPLYGGSHPLARYAARGFSSLGHQAELLDFAPFYPAYQSLTQITPDGRVVGKLTQSLLGLLGEAILARVRHFQPDLIFALAQAPLDAPLIRTLKEQGPLLAYWFVEDFRVMPYWRDLAPAADVFFVLQKEPFFKELKGLGVKKYAFLPLAADPEVYRPLTLSPVDRRRYGADLAFVGAGYPNRRQLFQALTDFDFKIWGSDWDLNSPLSPHIQNRGARVSEEEAAKIFNATRINLNLHSSPFHDGINPEGDYLNPRVFDLAAAGAFQLVDRRSQLPQFFAPETEMATFASVTELREKIAYFLEHEEERRMVAQAGRRRLLGEHCYTHRLGIALDLIQDFHPDALPGRAGTGNPLEQLKSQFPSDHPLGALLSRLPPGEPPELDRLVEVIKAGEEPLTEPEAILWFLQEFRQGLERGRF